MRIGVFSDAHGNAPALEKGLALLRENGAERLFFLGDAVGYIPGIQALDLLRDTQNLSCLFGNHERILLAGDWEGEREEVFRHRATDTALTDEQRVFLGTWADCGWQRERLPLDVLFCHGSPREPLDGYLYPDTDLEPETQGLEALSGGPCFVFCGHTHRPFIRRCRDRVFVNVGSCGMPRDDGRYGAVCLFDVCTARITVLRYDLEQETRALLAGLEVHPQVAASFERRLQGTPGDLESRGSEPAGGRPVRSPAE